MNVLLTCAGRRGYLVDYFRAALAGRGKVYAANSIAHAPAMVVADGCLVTKSIYDPGYVGQVFEFAKANGVELIVPLLDLELPVLARHKMMFSEAGICVAVSAESVCDICNDKWMTQEFLKTHGFSVVWSSVDLSAAEEAIRKGIVCYPLFVKPRWGMASIGIAVAENDQELRILHGKVRRDLHRSHLHVDSARFGEQDVLIQEAMEGSEYGLDVLNDFSGNYVTTFVKRKGDMRAGETDSAVTVEEPFLLRLGAEISRALRHVGNLDCDVFYDGEDAFILEMNPRFGGGYPFSHLAGANVPLFYISQVEKREVDPSVLRVRPGVYGMKNIVPRVICPPEE